MKSVLPIGGKIAGVGRYGVVGVDQRLPLERGEVATRLGEDVTVARTNESVRRYRESSIELTLKALCLFFCWKHLEFAHDIMYIEPILVGVELEPGFARLRYVLTGANGLVATEFQNWKG